MQSSPLALRGPHTVVRAMAHARNALLVQLRAAARMPDEGSASAFVHLVAAIEAAFRKEETLMEAIGVPGVREQRRDNALLLNALHHATPRIEAGELAIGREVLAVLPELLSLRRGRAPGALAGRAHGRRPAHKLRHA